MLLSPADPVGALTIEQQFVRTSRPLYAHLVTLLEGAIARGDLPSGSRLPPERELANRLRISRTTVVSAYRELESRGLLRGYVGRGTFVCASPEPTGAPFAWRGKIAAAALRSSDSTLRETMRHSSDARLLSLAAGEPAIDCFPTAAFRKAIDRVLTRDAHAAWRHGPTEGQPALREAIAERFGVAAESVLVISGAQQGLDLLARCLIDPGDSVIVDRPGYLGAIQSFHAAGAKLIGWDIAKADVDELEDLLVRYRPKLIYTNPTFENPTGITMPIRTRRELLRLAERYRVPIVEDATYRELYFRDPPPPSLRDLDAPGHRDLLEQLLESARARTSTGLALGRSVDRRSDGDHQAAARSAHAEPGAVRDGDAHPRWELRRAPGDLAHRARAPVHGDARRPSSGTSRRARSSSRARRADSISGAAWLRTSAPGRSSIARWREAWPSCPATRSIPIPRVILSCGSVSRASCRQRWTMRSGGWRRRWPKPRGAARAIAERSCPWRRELTLTGSERELTPTGSGIRIRSVYHWARLVAAPYDDLQIVRFLPFLPPPTLL